MTVSWCRCFSAWGGYSACGGGADRMNPGAGWPVIPSRATAGVVFAAMRGSPRDNQQLVCDANSNFTCNSLNGPAFPQLQPPPLYLIPDVAMPKRFEAVISTARFIGQRGTLAWEIRGCLAVIKSFVSGVSVAGMAGSGRGARIIRAAVRGSPDDVRSGSPGHRAGALAGGGLVAAGQAGVAARAAGVRPVRR